ncbi:hypothetical protein [Thalassotalea litorea]|uniref:hypothetical protein n=1 Tax=Thalassotalea litorea TaxID=2020715 RepID=UPI00373699AE
MDKVESYGHGWPVCRKCTRTWMFAGRITQEQLSKSVFSVEEKVKSLGTYRERYSGNATNNVAPS